MCRWMAWLGQPVLLEELLFKPEHGIVDQSREARLGAETTNGDGFGVGWYGTGAGPGVYRSVSPAWSDRNLRHLAGHIRSPLFLAHVRAAIGSIVQETNCHPFRSDRWLFVHNGYVADFHALRRDLMLAVAPERFADVEGTTDSEVLFALALGLGLDEDPLAALERTVALVEATARRHRVTVEVQGTFGVSDGERVWAVRYSTSDRARSLYASGDVEALRRLHPENARFAQAREGDRLIVSEPFSDLPGVWHEIPARTGVCLEPGGRLTKRPFTPAAG